MSENLQGNSRLVDFYGRDFLITPDVLIPRPETEQIIDTVLNLVGRAYLPGVKPSKAVLPEDLTIIDVGTGSGCIATTLAAELPKAKVVATDVSEKALKVAQKNAERHGVTPTYIISYLMEKVNISDFSTPVVVVANLPYVDESWDWIDKEALSKEPALALYADNGGLELIFKLIDQVVERGIKYLILEADPCQHERIIDYANKKGLVYRETRGFALYLSE